MKKLTLGMFGLVFLMATSLIPSTSTAAAVAPEFGEDILIFALPYDFDEYSIHTADSYATNQWASAVYGQLYKRQAASDRDYVPSMAASMPVVSASGLNFTVTLQSGLVFSNGEALTADDLIFSLKVAMTPAIDTFQYSTYVSFMNNESMVKVDDLTVQVNLLRTFAFPFSLLNVALIPQDHFQSRFDRCNGVGQVNNTGVAADCLWNDPDGRDAISSGPFMIDNIDNTNEVVTVVANPLYYEFDKVKTDKIIFQKIATKAAAISELAAGNIDILDSQYVPGLTELDSLTGVYQEIVGDPSSQEVSLNHLNTYFGSGVDIPGNSVATGAAELWADALNVRKAMSHIVDRNFAANSILEGLALPAASFFPAASLGWNASLAPRNFSVDVARTYMEMAGFDYSTLTSDGAGGFTDSFFDVTVLSPNTNPARNLWSTAYALELPKIGIGVAQHVSTGWGEISPRTFGYTGAGVGGDAGLPPSYADGGFDVFFVGYGWALDWNPGVTYNPEGNCNSGSCDNFYNFDLDATKTPIGGLITDYLSELDFDLRIALAGEIQTEVFAAIPALPLVFPQSHWGWADDVVGIDALLISTTDTEWDLVRKTSFTDNTDNTPFTATDTTTATTTTTDTVQNTETATITESPADVTAIMFGVFFTSLIAIYRRRRN